MIKYFSFLSIPLLAMLVLIFVGIGDARHVYTNLLLEREQAKAVQLQGLIGDFLDAGLKVSFVADILNYLDRESHSSRRATSGKILDKGSDKSIAVVAGFVADENLMVFTLEGDDKKSVTRLYPSASPPLRPNFPHVCDLTGPHQSDTAWWVITPLLRHGASKPVGCIAQAIPPHVIDQGLENLPQILLITFVTLSFLLAMALLLLQKRSAKGTKHFQSLSAAAFFIMAGVITLSSVSIYKNGVYAKADQYARSLAHQLSIIPNIGRLSEEDLHGVNNIVENFYSNASEMARFELSFDDKTLIHYPKHSRVPADAEFLSAAINDSGSATIKVYPQASVVRDKIINNVINFAALFVSCCFIAYIWFRLVTSVSELRFAERQKANSVDHQTLSSRHSVTLVQCVWFLAVFMEGLNASFMPDYLRSIATHSNLYSLLFSFFFAAFVLLLIPAGKLVSAVGAKSTVLVGCILTAVGAALMATNEQLEIAFAARFISGAGHGLLFIAIQSYILNSVASSQRASGSARIVFAQNSGILSGAAMGALMFIYVGAKGIFLSATAVAIVNVFLVYLFMAKRSSTTNTETAPQPAVSFAATLSNATSDVKFLVSSLFVGTYSKIIYNGAIFFTIPILLAQLEFSKPQIGQLLMLFAFSVMLSNYFVPKVAKRFNTNSILLMGMLGSALGCFILGAFALLGSPIYQHTAVVVGVIVVGYSNGLIAAPIVASVLDTQFANRVGVNSSLSLYRFVERIGHVLGPIIFAWSFAFFDAGEGQMQLFQIIAAVTTAFAFIFWLSQRKPSHQ